MGNLEDAARRIRAAYAGKPIPPLRDWLDLAAASKS